MLLLSPAAAQGPWSRVISSIPTYGSECLGKEPVTLDERVWAMQFAPDGRSLYAVGDSIQRIEWPSKARMAPLWMPSKDEGMVRASFSPDGKLFARAIQGPEICIHETATGQLLQRLGQRDSRANAMAWSPDGELIAFGGEGEILIHRGKSGELQRRIPQPGPNAIMTLAWSADGKWLAAAIKDEKSVFLHALAGDAPPLALPGSYEARLSFTPDSRTLAVCGASLYHWDLAAGRVIQEPQRGGDYGFAVHSPDGRFLAIGSENKLEIRDARSGAEIFQDRDESMNTTLYSAAFSPDGSVLAYGVEDRIKFRDTRTWAEIDADEVLRAPVTAAAFSDDGRYLVTGGMNGDLVLWDWEKKTPVWVAKAAPDTLEITSLSISQDKRWIGVAQSQWDTRIPPVSMVDFATGKERNHVKGSSGNVASLFRKDGRTAWVVMEKQVLAEWDPAAKKPVRTLALPFPNNPVARITSWEADPVKAGWIRWGSGCYNPETGELSPAAPASVMAEADPMPSRAHDYFLSGGVIYSLPQWNHINFGRGEGGDPSVKHPSGLLVFTGAWRKGVRVFDLLSQTEVHEIQAAVGEVKTLAISPDGRNLVIGSTGGLRYLTLGAPGKGLAWPAPVGGGHIPSLVSRVELPTSEVVPRLDPTIKWVPQPEPKPLPPPADEVLWQLMGSTLEWEAYRAAWALGKRPDFTAFLATKLSPAGEVPPATKKMLEEMLKDSSHEVRQTAARQWLDLGLPPLDKASYEALLEGKLPELMPPAFEYDVFLVGTMGLTKPIPPLIPLSAHKRMMRAIMILGDDRSEASQRLLEQLAAGSESAPQTMAAKRALVRRGR